jgi:molybdopterin molybdotransferase
MVRERIKALPVESRPLASLAGAVLAQSVRAERDQPPFDRVTMDGIAISSASWRAGRRRFAIAGTQAAGRPPLRLEAADACLEVMTGAVLPEGCDCVIPVERLQVEDGSAEVNEDAVVEPFANVHTRGLDCREGDMLLARGTRLGAPELAVLASAGLPRADVHADPRIIIVATGDELVEPGEPIEGWQIRRSNSHALRAALALRGFLRVALRCTSPPTTSWC